MVRGCFDYFYTTSVNAQLDVDNIGNCTIKANDDFGNTYFLFIKTKMGLTYVIEYGPYNEYDKPDHISYLFDKFKYNEYKIEKRIEKFLNTPNRVITQAEEVSEKDVVGCLISPFELYGDCYGGE